MKRNEMVEVSPGVYWLGFHDSDTGLQYNPYLIIDNSGPRREAIVIDPGSIPNYNDFSRQLKELIRPEELKYVVLQHQAPDLCACVPLLEQEFPNFMIAAHWRAGILISHYGVKSPFYYVDRENYQLKLTSGREILFFHIPYAHSPSAIMTYDKATKVLFTGDLFGAFTKTSELYSDSFYFEAMALFHENYMPSGEIVNTAARKVEKIQQEFGLELLAPQHGSIIRKENISRAVYILKDLECGALLRPVKKELSSPANIYQEIIGEIIILQYGVFGRSNWENFLQQRGLLGQDKRILEDYLNKEGLDKLLELSAENGGQVIIDTLKNRILRLINSYGLKVPKVYRDGKYRQAEDLERDFENTLLHMSGTMDKLQQTNESLQRTLSTMKDDMVRDRLTGLYNSNYLSDFVQSAHAKLESGALDQFALAALGIDGFQEMVDNFGLGFADRVLVQVGLTLSERLNQEILFKYEGPCFCLFLPGAAIQDASNMVEELRNYVHEQNIERTRLTLSAGMVYLEKNYVAPRKFILERAMNKLKTAQKAGGNRLISSLEKITGTFEPKILIVEPNAISCQIIENIVKSLGMTPLAAENGIAAVQTLIDESVSMVITETLLPKRDGYYVLDYIKRNSNLLDIPVLFVSGVDYPEDIIRALDKGAVDYIVKPFYPEVLEAKIGRYLKVR